MSEWEFIPGQGTEVKQYPLPEPGDHPVVCCAIVGLGTHETSYKGKAKQQKGLLLVYEILDELQPDGTPFYVWRKLPIPPVFGPDSNLRQWLESWRGKTYTDATPVSLHLMRGVLGSGKILHGTSKSHPDRTYATLASIGPLRNWTGRRTATEPEFVWPFVAGQMPEFPEWLPLCFGEKVGDIVASAIENQRPQQSQPQASSGVRLANSDRDDSHDDMEDIPF